MTDRYTSLITSHTYIYYNYVVTSHTRHLPPKSRSMSQLCRRNLLSGLADLSIWCICIINIVEGYDFLLLRQTDRQTDGHEFSSLASIQKDTQTCTYIQTHTHRVTHVLTDFDAHLCINIWTPLHVCIKKKNVVYIYIWVLTRSVH